MREFALLAGISTVATSLDLLFVAVFSLGAFASLSLSVFLALAVYAGTRHWLLQPMSGSSMRRARSACSSACTASLREVEARPRDSAELLTRLLRDLFEPLEVQHARAAVDALARARRRLGAAGAAAATSTPTRRATARLDRAALRRARHSACSRATMPG